MPTNKPIVHHLGLRIRQSPSRLTRSSDAGETLIESLASILILGILIIPFILVVTNSSGWLAADSEREQALAYGRQVVETVRSAVDTAGALPAMTQTMTSAEGLKYTEMTSSLGSPTWDSTATLDLWKVTVSWEDPNHNAVSSLSLQFVTAPSIGPTGSVVRTSQQGGGTSSESESATAESCSCSSDSTDK